MTIHDTLTHLVAPDLAERGITLVLSAGGQTRGDASCDAVEAHGDRVAVIHLTDGSWAAGTPRYRELDGWHAATVIRVDYPAGDASTGIIVRKVFERYGFTVEWDGDGGAALTLRLG